MRKVNCTEYVWEKEKRIIDRVIIGTFHQWGNEYEEFETGPGNYSVAIVELADGSVKTFHPTDIKFIE